MRRESTASNVRRSALACVLLLLTLTAHAVAAGSLPSLTAIAGATLIAGALAWAVAARRRSSLSLVVILFSGQLLIHVSLVALGHHGVSYLPDQRMLLAHLLAAVGAAVIFAHSEQIAVTWTRAARRLLGVPQLPTVEIPTREALRTQYRLHATDVFDGTPCSRRGPPALNGVLTFA